MKTFIFTATTSIEAETLSEAKEIFANNSFDFASTAEIDEVDEQGNQKMADTI